METQAVVLERPGELGLRSLRLTPLAATDVLVEIDRSGVSAGTERLLYEGRMPAFPGMGYPLVPGYESTGRVVETGAGARDRLGSTVFVPGSTAFEGARGLFGGAARRVVLPAARAMTIEASLADPGILLALAATARHAIAGGAVPDLIVGHGVLGRLVARVAVALGGAPVVWETQPLRRDGDAGYAVVDPAEDARRGYATIVDASGDAALLDTLVQRLAPGGEIVLAGFYDRLSFAFAPAFMREARLRIAAQFTRADLDAVTTLVASGALSLDGLVTHVADARDAAAVYPKAFGDPACLKLVLDWSQVQ